MSNIQKCYECNKDAKWLYMPGDNFEEDCYCDEHVPKGCSCNSESFYFDNDSYPKEQQIESFLKYPNLKVLNYGKESHVHGKHIAEISDQNTIKDMFETLPVSELLWLEIIPLDENMKEFPCCEYWYYEGGVEIESSDIED